MSNVLSYAGFAYVVAVILGVITAFVWKSTKSSVAVKVFQVIDCTMTATGFTVVFLWIANIIFGI